MKRQIKLLNNRLSALENENQQRYQKEALIYSLGLIYLAIKAYYWLKKIW